MRKIGILALQGDFAKHAGMLASLGVETAEVKLPAHLEGLDGLVIPGGESTTLTMLMRDFALYDPIVDFAKSRPVMGTCAGSILVASQVDDQRVRPLNLINMSIARNAYGRQVDSFITHIEAPCLNGEEPYRAIFIRAPQIERVGPETETLITHEGKPVMVRQKNVLALTFHPELTDDPRIHRYFLENLAG